MDILCPIDYDLALDNNWSSFGCLIVNNLPRTIRLAASSAVSTLCLTTNGYILLEFTAVATIGLLIGLCWSYSCIDLGVGIMP